MSLVGRESKMKVLLIGEASGVHRNLKIGLTALGVQCLHMVHNLRPQSRVSDASFAAVYPGVIGGIARNIMPFVTISKLGKYDVINFTNGISSVIGRYTKYYDLPLLRSKTDMLSYYALSCDELGLIRRNNIVPYRPCASCLASDHFSRDCEFEFNKQYEKNLEVAKQYFDFGASSAIEYDNASQAFPGKFSRIQFPIDTQNIKFRPATAGKLVNIVHTPTKRGFKGTDVVIEAIRLLRSRRSDFHFEIVEGLNYDEYLDRVARADIIIDQVHSQSPGINALEMMAAGKIVLTGATNLGKSYFDFTHELPAIDAPPNSNDLAEVLVEALETRTHFPRLAEQGRDYVAKHHNVKKVADLFMSEWRARL